MKFKFIAGALMSVLMLAGCATRPQTAAVPVPELNLSVVPDVAATYVTTRSEVARDDDAHHAHEDHATTPVEWRFFRESDRVEIEDISTQTGEIWQRDGNTQFFFKLFHADRRAIEYRLDDLQILGISAAWQQHALLIEPAVLASLKTVEAGWRDGYPYRRLQGQDHGATLDLWWRVDLNVPLRIRRSDAGHTELTELKAVSALAQSTWSRRDSGHYEFIDYADLGDRESDPFVIRVQAMLPGGQVHSH